MSNSYHGNAPYVGPRAFTGEEEAIFFGRDAEAAEVVSRIIANTEVLVYAQSGAGKTSLINAGIIPGLKRKRCKPLLARVDSPLGGRDVRSVKNVYVFNALRSWAGPSGDEERFASMTLKEYLSEIEGAVTDQYTCLVAIFDQFEGFCTHYPECWQQRGEFFEQVAEALQDRQLNLRFVVAMRDDYIAQLDAFAPLLPDRLRTRFHLERLRKSAAVAAVTGPLEGTGIAFADGVASSLIDNLMLVKTRDNLERTISVPGEFVEALHLQIVCRDIWEKITKTGEREITLDHLSELQGVDQALARYYDASLTYTVDNSSLPLREIDLRNWFDRSLITQARTRGTTYRGDRFTDGLPNEAVDRLIERLIIRGNEWAGAVWLELTHDRFIDPIRDSNERWFLKRSEAFPMGSHLDQASRRWEERGRKDEDLLAEPERQSAEAWLKTPECDQFNPGRLVLQFVEASRAWHERREANEHRQLRYISVIQALAARAPAQSVKAQDERAALLARQAFLFSERHNFREIDQVDDALREVLSVDWFHNIMVGHSNRVTSVAFFPDGRAFVSGSWDGTIRRWIVDRAGEGPDILHTGAEAIGSMAISPDGWRLAAGGSGGMIRLWNLAVPDGAETPLVWDNGAAVWSLGFDRRGKLLITGGGDRHVRLWRVDALSDGPVTLDARSRTVHSVACCPTRSLLAVSRRSRVMLWSLRRLDTKPRILDHLKNRVRAVAFSPDGKRLAVGTVEGTIWLWELNNQGTAAHKPEILKGHEDVVRSLAFSPVSSLLASASDDATIRLWDLSPSGARSVLRGHDNEVLAVAFHPSGYSLVSAGDDATVRLWDCRISPARPKVLKGHSGSVRSVAFSPDGASLASGSFDSSVRVWDVEKGGEPLVLAEHRKKVNEVAFHPAGSSQIVASASDDSAIIVWALPQRGEENATILWKWKHHRARKQRADTPRTCRINTVAFSPNGQTLAAGSSDSLVRLWNLGLKRDTPKPKAQEILRGHRLEVRSVAFSPDGRTLASGSSDGSVRLWDLEHVGAQPWILKTKDDRRVRIVRFSPTDRLLAYGTADGELRLWDLDRPDDEPRLVSGNGEGLRSLAFSPDGRIIATGSSDGTVRLWDIKRPDAEPRLFTDHQERVWSVAFHPTQPRLATGSQDRTIRLWVTDTRLLADIVCERVRRNLNWEEWKRFIGADIGYERTCPCLPGDREDKYHEP